MQNKGLSRRAVLFGRKYRDCDSGATAIEYGLVAVLIGLAVVAVAPMIGSKATNMFKCSADQIDLSGGNANLQRNWKACNARGQTRRERRQQRRSERRERRRQRRRDRRNNSA